MGLGFLRFHFSIIIIGWLDLASERRFPTASAASEGFVAVVALEFGVYVVAIWVLMIALF